jgi:dihydroorotase
MSDLIITGGRVIDPAQNIDGEFSVLIRDGLVEFIGAPGEAKAKASADAEKLDATGKIVTPGLIDMHVHFREPGMEAQETIASGAAAAVAGGFSSVACMANTDPALDSAADINFVYQKAAAAGLANVFPVGAITAGREGRELAEMAQMARVGAVGFSDDGVAVPTAGLLRKAMTYAKMLGKPIIEHCEDASLTGEGVMNEGYVSTVLGLPGAPSESEEIIIARDVAIARLTGAHLHVQHVSTAGSLEIIRNAKRQGVRVTCEVCPHHLVLTDESVRGYDPIFKMAPPLRAQADVDACLKGLLDGTIDAIASDHAPHLAEAKEQGFLAAPCGVIGLETMLGILLLKLVHGGKISLLELLPKLTVAPAGILGLGRGVLKPGTPGDVTVIDLDREWVVDPAKFKSKSLNCPFTGWQLKGAAVATVVGGKVAFRDGV